MSSNQYAFFTLNDFLKDGGETIRIRGIANALTKQGQDVTLVSNVKNFDGFDSRIKHIDIGYLMNKRQKRVFQFLLSILPFFIMKIFYFRLFIHLNSLLEKNGMIGREIIFCGYLDNSIGYFLKRSGVSIIVLNDIHGIGPVEFKYKANHNVIQTVYNRLRYWSACKLDTKVFALVDGLIFVSKAMQDYFLGLYPQIHDKQRFIVRDGVSKAFCHQKIDATLLKNLQQKYTLQEADEVVFFAGNFKDLGGVLDLFEAFRIILTVRENTKMVLVGAGEYYQKLENMIRLAGLENKVILAGRVPYMHLKTYQQLADVIVCPDKKHPYSDLIPHIKYFDALASGKIVINGDFASIREINENDVLSVSFQPSNTDDLAKKIVYCLDNQVTLEQKYSFVKDFACKEFSYDKAIMGLL